MFKTIKSKILSIFIILIFVLGVNCVWAVLNFQRLSQSIDNIMQANYRSIVDAQNMSIALERQDSAELSYILTRSKLSVDVFKENETEFLGWLSKAKDNITEPGEKEILEKIDTQYNGYIEKFFILNEMQNSKKLSNIQEYYYNDIFPMFENVKNECRDLLMLNQNAMLEHKNTAHEIADKATYLTVILSIVTIFAGLIISIYLTLNKIIKPIENLMQKIKGISEGDYSQKLDVSGDDEITQLAGEFNNMTSKLQAYEQLNIKKIVDEKLKSESIVESISDGIIVSEVDNKISLVNMAAEKIFNINEKDVMGKHFLEAIKNEEVFKSIEKIRQDSYDEGVKKYMDITIKNDDGFKFYRVNSSSVKDKNDIPIGVVTLIQDITKLKEIDRMKSEFVSTVSHEFRTPLTSMNMSIGLLLEEAADETNGDHYELLNIINEDITRLTNLVNDLLDLSRLESGKTLMEIKPCSVEKIIQDTLRTIYVQANEKNIQIINNIACDLPMVKADYEKISIVIMNLASNALKFTPTNGTGKIEICARKSMGKVLVSVSDNGVGIPEEYLDRIFDKFVQVKGKAGISKEGSGLGLAISRNIVKSHGEEIWAKSKIGEGSTFYFTMEICG